MNFASHNRKTIILSDRSVTQPFCTVVVNLLVPFHLMTKNLRYLRNVSVTTFFKVFVSCIVKTKVLAEEANSW